MGFQSRNRSKRNSISVRSILHSRYRPRTSRYHCKRPFAECTRSVGRLLVLNDSAGGPACLSACPHPTSAQLSEKLSPSEIAHSDRYKLRANERARSQEQAMAAAVNECRLTMPALQVSPLSPASWAGLWGILNFQLEKVSKLRSLPPLIIHVPLRHAFIVVLRSVNLWLRNCVKTTPRPES